LDEINAAQTTREKSANLMMAFRQAAAKNDVETMSAKLEELEKLDAKMPALVAMKIDLLVAKKEWAAATKAIDELPAGQVRQMSVTMLGRKLGMSTDGDYPQEFLKAVSKAYASVVEDAKGRTNPFDFVSLAYLQWKAQDKDGAVASANKAVEAAKVPGAPIPAAPLERFAKSLADGTLPTMQEFSGWLREAMPARTAPANPAPATPPPAKKE
jgi:hypothetical protein